MPSVQIGRVEKLPSGRYSARWYDEHGKRQRRGGFATKSEAREWLRDRVDEVEALRRGDVPTLRRRNMPTFGELVDEYLAQHSAEANTLRTLKARLRYALEGPKLDGEAGWRELRVDRLDVQSIGAWRKRLPERSAWAIMKALRQLLHYAVRVGLVEKNVATLVPNPEPKRREIPTFETIAELERIAAELPAATAAVALVAGLTGLRPEEWLALERRDVDRNAGVIHIRRVFTDGQLKLYGKQSRSLRAVPLPKRALEAIDAIPARIDSRLLFPHDSRDAHLVYKEWREDHWTAALKAAGLAHRGPYALRHTYASFAIAAGVSLFELARFMGTSVEQIDRTYGHLLPDSIDRTRTAIDAFVAAEEARAESFGP